MKTMRDLRSIILPVELLAGTDIRDACCDICELANRVGCTVQGSFNGVKLWAIEGGNPLTLADRYREAQASERTVKIAKTWG